VKRFLYSIQGRIITILLLFMTLSLIASWFSVQYLSQKILMREKEQKLMSFTSLLDYHMQGQSYDDILAAHNATDASKEEKIAILNAELDAMTEAVALSSAGLGVGYYSLDLDAIITYGPYEEFHGWVGKAIGHDHPGRTVMATNTANVTTGTMVRGEIMNAMRPIERDGRVIGYIWANELKTSIEKEFNDTSNTIIGWLVVVYVFAVGFAIYLSRRTTRSITQIVRGVRELRFDLTKTLPDVNGELGEIVESINTMATDVAKANEDHNALLMAEAANLAQRDFLARMSHEIRTPMNGVIGMTLLAKNAATEEKRLEYLGKIHSSATILLGIINDILDFSKIEAGKMDIELRPFLVADVAESIRDLIGPRTADKGLDLIISVSENVPKAVIGDDLRLSQVLLNLLGNAVKFTSEGSITLEVRTSDEQYDDKTRLFFAVRDTGIGLDKQHQQDIFKPFTQADNSTARKFGGTGLGLSISRALVELMGGAISLTSELGVGSEFKFFIEVEPCDESEVASEETVSARRFDGITALIVEDNDINQEIAVAVLSDMGFVTALADNGEIAVNTFLEKDYDIIFMDIRMPVMDGLEASEQIRAIERGRAAAGDLSHPLHVPIIAMTANAMQEDRDASRDAGMDGHISKPISIEEIQEVLGRIFTEE
jgi:signal transduction histidine kinase/CheY-like chemotaxis protein